jgi:hypothetical protein
VDDVSAVVDGGLINNSQFFGSNTSEVVSRPTHHASWNGDVMLVGTSTQPWFNYGGSAGDGTAQGVFSVNNLSAGVQVAFISHRTILSGY